jgi:predicted Zn-dependent peptidase
MPVSYKRIQLSDSIGYTEILDPKFKTNTIRINFFQPMQREMAAKTALAFSLLAISNEKLPSMESFSLKLDALYGLSISSGVSKFGDFQSPSITVSTIADEYALQKEPLLSEMLDLLLTCLLHPHLENDGFSEFAFQIKKKDLLDTIEAEINEKRSYATAQALETAFQTEPAALSCYGKKEDVALLTPQNTYEAYQHVLHHAPAEIYFVGATAHPEVKGTLQAAFSALQRDAVAIPSFRSPSPAKSEPATVVEPLPVNQAKMVLVLKSTCENRFAVQTMNYILGATPSSKLFANVREKLSLCYYCSSSYLSPKQTLVISSGVEHDNLEKAKTEILHQLTAIQEGDITDTEMHSAKMSIYNTLHGIGDSAGSYLTWYHGCYLQNEYLTPMEMLQRYQAITKEDVMAAARSLTLDTVYIMDTKKEEA